MPSSLAQWIVVAGACALAPLANAADEATMERARAFVSQGKGGSGASSSPRSADARPAMRTPGAARKGADGPARRASARKEAKPDADKSATASDDPRPNAGPGPSRAAAAADAKREAHLDRSGKKRTGKASYYAKKFTGRKMADGTPMSPHDDNAASKTLPLGTKAKVTNKETGQTAVVTIQDRGPYVDGRIVDLSPSTAQKIGIGPKEGVAEVEVAPITVPKADGGVVMGQGAKP